MISHLDHLVLTTRDVRSCLDFYSGILGMEVIRFGEGRVALQFGQQKINIHEYGGEIKPRAHLPVPGSLDLCLIISISTEELLAHLDIHGIGIAEGPVSRTGARGEIQSVYIRDPDLNLIELSVYINEQS
ncbi:VOC family protein [Citrobacter meridianamericanus]|uniref:VOC family protein n=1 Tax=Citrobacter meridianamericanus TaxID=2894201 RepID=A0ABT1BFZ1_9ENTR|nr:VOC family protein [Citrobacter meridianamericanus]MCO5784663.1 VOC family protein [Citrobacter meridianamericanus]